MAAERISADDLLHLRRQAIEAGAQIDRLASEKDLCSRRQGDHPDPRSADRTRRSAFSLTLLSTRTRTPSGRSISITLFRPSMSLLSIPPTGKKAWVAGPSPTKIGRASCRETGIIPRGAAYG